MNTQTKVNGLVIESWVEVNQGLSEEVTSSWVIGHSVLFYHGLDWVYLQELWRRQGCIIYCN